MRRQRRIKIIATLGPASSTRDQIAALFDAGADVFRINMSHTPHDKLREFVDVIRSIEHEIHRPIGILADLQGPKLRVGAFKDGPVMLVKGAAFTLDSDKSDGDVTRVQLPHPEILAALEPGHRLILDDGKVVLVAERCTPKLAECRVVVGGKLSNRKGVSLPDTTLPVSAPDRQGPLRSRCGPQCRCRLGGALLRPAPRRRGRGEEDRARAAPPSWPRSRSRRL